MAWVGELDALGAVHALQAAHRRVPRRRLTDARRARRRAGRRAAARRSIAARLTGDWTPTAEWYDRSSPASHRRRSSRPYPFCLASPLDQASPRRRARLCARAASDWQIEWKWDGIRAQLVKRDGQSLPLVARRGRDRRPLSRRSPHAASALPDGTVLDGEILAFRDGRPLPFCGAAAADRTAAASGADEPRRTGRLHGLRHPRARRARHRDQPLTTRRELLDAIVAQAQHAAPAAPARAPTPCCRSTRRTSTTPGGRRDAAGVAAAGGQRLGGRRRPARQLTRARRRGLMIKRLSSAYGVGRKRGDWWKWKIAPHSIDAVLIYAQPGSGKRASLLTDYTFGLWSGGELVPVAKAYSGLSNEEIAEMDRWIRRHTVERFGPVRHVEPVHVFELGFEAIAPSSRHRSGVAVRFPRMLRWRSDKAARDADTLEALVALIDARAVTRSRTGHDRARQLTVTTLVCAAPSVLENSHETSGAGVRTACHLEDGIRYERRTIQVDPVRTALHDDCRVASASCAARDSGVWCAPERTTTGMPDGTGCCEASRHIRVAIQWTRRARERTALRSSAPAPPGHLSRQFRDLGGYPPRRSVKAEHRPWIAAAAPQESPESQPHHTTRGEGASDV